MSRYGPEALDYVDFAKPVPDQDQVLMEMCAASANYAYVKTSRANYHLGRPLLFDPGLDITRVRTGRNPHADFRTEVFPVDRTRITVKKAYPGLWTSRFR